jgi:hypothetical protein
LALNQTTVINGTEIIDENMFAPLGRYVMVESPSVNGSATKDTLILPNGNVIDPNAVNYITTTCPYTGNTLYIDFLSWTATENTWLGIITWAIAGALQFVPGAQFAGWILAGATYFADFFFSDMAGTDGTNTVILFGEGVFDNWGIPIYYETGFYTDQITIQVPLPSQLSSVPWIGDLGVGIIPLNGWQFIPLDPAGALLLGPRSDMWAPGYSSPWFWLSPYNIDDGESPATTVSINYDLQASYFPYYGQETCVIYAPSNTFILSVTSSSFDDSNFCDFSYYYDFSTNQIFDNPNAQLIISNYGDSVMAVYDTTWPLG